MFASIFGDGEEFPKLLIICQKIELNILLTVTQHQLYVNITCNAFDILLNTSLNSAGTAGAMFDEILQYKTKYFRPDSLSVKMLSVKF